MTKEKLNWKPKRNITGVACWNVTSWKGKVQDIIISETEKHSMDICGISKKKWKGQGTCKHRKHIIIYSGKAKHERTQSGVCILLHEKYAPSIEDREYINDILLRTSLKPNHTTIHLISTYAPDISKPVEDSEKFYRELRTSVDKISNSHKIAVFMAISMLE
uniref:Uncharacterized protein n=1 Tax=Dendroctonus ponderosae TaxID=77166 RepID=A0AAR5P981_DENPD